MFKVSVSVFTRSTDVSRYGFDMAASTFGSNDPKGTSRKVSAWLCGAGMHPVSHFNFCGLADICRYGFDVAMSMAGSIDPMGMFGGETKWLCGVIAS